MNSLKTYHPINSTFKYVVGEIKGEFDSFPVALVFPRVVTHANVAKMFYRITGAGFGEVLSNKEVRLFGVSESLGIQVDEENDLPLVRQAIGMY